MLRNLKIMNGSPPTPMRAWRKNTGPELSILIRIATTTRIGSRITSPSVAMIRSTARFSIGVSTAVAAGDGAQRIGDAIHVPGRHPRIQRQRDDALPLGGGLGQLGGRH